MASKLESTSLQKQYVICIKQYVHVFSLWLSVQQQTDEAKKEEYSWNGCCLLSGSLHMASRILKTGLTLYSLSAVKI